jgi:alpha-1,3-rhamnosyl/mannosyltransferase
MPSPPSLVINASPAFSPDPSGVGRTIISVSRALQQQASPFAHRFYYQKWIHRGFPVEDHQLITHRGPSLKRFFRPMIRSLRQAGGGHFTPMADLYWEPNHMFEPAIRSRIRVLTVHDLSTLRFPEWHPPKRLERFEAAFLEAIHSADHLVTVTRAVSRELQELEGIDPGRISVIPNGIDHHLFRPEPETGAAASLPDSRLRPGRYILFVGTIEPRKNLSLLLDAHQALPPETRRGFPLVVAGGDGWKSEELLRRIAQDPCCLRTGFVDNATLPDLYRGATVLVYPSHYEGFGLPPLEAMACGCPVIASSIPPHREVLGEAALFCDPGDPDRLAANIESLLASESLKNHYSQAGIRRAAGFSWERAAADLLKLLRKLAAI